MGKIVLTMQMSIDGVVSNEDRWMTLSEEIFEDYLEYYQSLEAIIIGGHSYSSMAHYWQNAEQSSHSPLERAIAERMNALPKVVISRSQLDLVWRNSEQILAIDDESVAREIGKLKQRAGKISVESGVGTWQRLIRQDLFDELWLLVHPVVASDGEKLFALADKPFSMNLSGSKIYKNGVVGLHYQK
ncbi:MULTISPECIES: dihydrofolate reductase family protein [unclassified Paenibacillus]|uniref:dihydrofolate reductase family protein n=1 Tax=unclassified Paenibacillus TaxID=185978 RepID=UPI001C0F7FBC|nr:MULTISPECIES: dihydrofolate reductase family protein [unclassified Paenibacillus]MBU5445471.1 dihydrofolate reductase family protein [Paenibacillus sp. MSJ-34]CAH0120934.1 putative protein YyaP [Paenibacillus sp. CECT 9249]